MSNPNEPTPNDLPPIPPPPPPHLGEGDDDVPLALTDQDEVAEILPPVELAADAATFDLPELPPPSPDDPASGVRLAEPASGLGLGGPDSGLPPIPEAVGPGESWVSEGGSDVLAGGNIPTALPASSASSSALFDGGPVPEARAEEVDLSAPSPSASSLFGESIPEAGPASGFLDAEVAAGDSAVNVDRRDPAVAPVAPASGWFTPEEGSIPVLPPEPAADAIDAELAGPLPETGHGAGSDVFAAAPPAAGLLGDQSDVIAATAGRDADPFAPPAARGDGRPSDIAIAFDQPPGGSTIQEAGAADDLPVADEEVPDADPMFGDSATLARTPPLPAEPVETFDLGAPVRGKDASSIFADPAESFDLGGPARGRDASSIHAEPVETFDLGRPVRGNDASSILADLEGPAPAAGPPARTPPPPPADPGEAFDLGGPVRGNDASSIFAEPAETFDLGRPAKTDDASSILADLTEPAYPPSDGSVVRIESPGIDPTISDEPPPADFLAPERTSVEDSGLHPNLWDHPPTEADVSTDGGDSELFSEERKPRSKFELTPTPPGSVDPFAGVDEAADPSLGSSSGSIFTAPGAAAAGGTAEGDAVEFSDHPTDSHVDFGLGDATYPDRTLREPVPPDSDLDLTDPDRAPLSSPSSDVLAAARRPGGRDSGTDSAVPLGGPGAGFPAGLEPASSTTSGFRPVAATPVRPKSSERTPAVQPSTGSVELDWVAGPSSAEVVLPDEPRARRPGTVTLASDSGVDYSRYDEPSSPSESAVGGGGGGGVNRRGGIGLLFGLLLGGGIASGVYYSGVIDQPGAPKGGGPVAVQPGTNPGPTTNPPPVAPATVTVADARAAIDAGDPARALKTIEATGATTPEAKAARGQARLLARLRELPAAAAADDEGLKAARADLEAVVNDADAAKTPEGEKAAVRAAVHLGLTHELAGDRARAKEVYGAAAKQFPKAADVFQAALDRLDATNPPIPAGTTSFRLTPADAERLAQAATLLFLQDEPAPAAAEPAEAGGHFWRAANLAAGGKYADAATAIDAAKTAHQARARALAGRGLNPLTDPLEQIFPRTCDDLKAYWELRRTLYEHKGVGVAFRDERNVGKVLDGFAALKTERDTARADAKLAGDKLATAQKGLLAEQEAMKAEKLTSTKLTTDLAKASDDLKKTAADLVKEKANVVAAEKELVAAKKQADLFTEKAKSLDAALAMSDQARKQADAIVAGVAAELRAGKILPEKHAPGDIVAAAKSAVSRATGPDLTALIPPSVAATIGAPATTGTLLDLAARAGKSEAAAKQATTALAAANAKYTADFTRAKADYDAALKKANDDADKLLTKTKTDAATALTKTKTEAAADLAKVTKDATAAEAKLKTDHAATLTKLKTDYDGTLAKLKTDSKAEVAAAERKAADADAGAKAAVAAAEKRFRDELANAVTPADALPLWLPLLTELRRPADADPALAAAAKVLKTVPPDSEDAGRAHAIAGLALALKGDRAAARGRFELARRNPAYAPDKDWARAAGVGLAALDDPSAPLRVTVDPARRRDPLEAARSLGAGIAAYNAGNYALAERALADAAWHDPDSPLPWYFLGAARWAAGNAAQARDDYRQGAVREAKCVASGRAVSAAIAPIQGPARSALDAARP